MTIESLHEFVNQKKKKKTELVCSIGKISVQEQQILWAFSKYTEVMFLRGNQALSDSMLKVSKTKLF